MSLRAGTSKAWVESTQANRMARGPSTVEMSPGVAVRVAVMMNQMNPPTTQTARTGLTRAMGCSRRR